jgi:hypothetical protein
MAGEFKFEFKSEVEIEWNDWKTTTKRLTHLIKVLLKLIIEIFNISLEYWVTPEIYIWPTSPWMENL